MVEHGTIAEKDLELFHKVDTVEDAYAVITRELTEEALDHPGGEL
jgi:predicted Rossmann-fold nucleotide-binding protein